MGVVQTWSDVLFNPAQQHRILKPIDGVEVAGGVCRRCAGRGK